MSEITCKNQVYRVYLHHDELFGVGEVALRGAVVEDFLANEDMCSVDESLLHILEHLRADALEGRQVLRCSKTEPCTEHRHRGKCKVVELFFCLAFFLLTTVSHVFLHHLDLKSKRQKSEVENALGDTTRALQQRFCKTKSQGVQHWK